MNSRAVVVASVFVAGSLFAADSVVKTPAIKEGGIASPIRPLKVFSPSEMAVRFFNEALRPYGLWIEVEGYGLCWKPKVGEKWAPYTVGQWTYSNYGWTWVSDEDFGAIVYHYGRWMDVKGEGWLWVPDLEWAPAWVSWRYGTEFLGWAPLPPSASWQPQTGLAPWVDRVYSIGPGHYKFCLIANIGDAALRTVILPENDNGTRIRRTVNTTNIASYRGSVFTGGPAYDWISSRTQEPVEILQIVKERSLLKYREQLTTASESPAKFRGIRRGNQLVLMAPEWGVLADPKRADNLGFHTEEVTEVATAEWEEGDVPPKVPKLKDLGVSTQRFVANPVVLNGWEAIADEATRKALQTKVARESAGLTPANFPARAVDPEFDLPRNTLSNLR